MDHNGLPLQVKYEEVRGEKRLKVLTKTLIVLAVLTASLAVGISAYGSSSHSTSTTKATAAAATPHSGGNITIDMASATAWVSLDPNSAAGSPNSNQMIYAAIYGQLFEVGAHNKIVPDLALSVKGTQHNQVWTIKLRPGVQFTDGTPLNAQAVKTDFEFNLNAANGFQIAAFLPITSISTPNSTTVVLHMKSAWAPTAYVLAATAWGYIPSPTARAKEGETGFGTAPVGAGPFEVSNNIPNDKLVVTRNPSYWDKGKPYLNSITYLNLAGGPTSLQALEAGTTQMVYGSGLGPSDILSAKTNSNVKVVTTPGLQWFFMEMNELRPPFNNIKAREAVFRAVDQATIAKNELNGLYTPTQVLNADGETPFIGYTSPKFPGYDPSLAKSLVKSIPGGVSFTDEPLENPAVWGTMADALENEFNAVGMNSTVDLVPKATAVAQVITTHNYQASLFLYGNYLPAVLGLTFTDECGSTLGSFCDKKVDSLIAKMYATTNTTQQAADLKALSEETNSKYEILPLWSVPYWLVYSSSLNGVDPEWWTYPESIWTS